MIQHSSWPGLQWIMTMLFLIVSASYPAPAQEERQAQEGRQETRSGPSGAPALMFLAGRLVTVPSTPSPSFMDVFASGETILIENASIGDTYAAGGSMRITSARVQDITIAGGTLTIQGAIVSDDLVAAGQSIITSNDIAIGQNVVLAARHSCSVGASAAQPLLRGRKFSSAARWRAMRISLRVASSSRPVRGSAAICAIPQAPRSWVQSMKS
jgi:hypothetical protein